MGIDWEEILGVEDNLGDAYESLISDDALCYPDDFYDEKYYEEYCKEIPKALYHNNNGIISFDYKGKTISFNRIWANHVFDENEICDLISGRSITFVYTNDKGKNYSVRGKLSGCDYNGKKFIGFSAYSFTPYIPPETTGYAEDLEITGDDACVL